jgi:hypothetical protein
MNKLILHLKGKVIPHLKGKVDLMKKPILHLKGMLDLTKKLIPHLKVQMDLALAPVDLLTPIDNFRMNTGYGRYSAAYNMVGLIGFNDELPCV